MRQQGIHREAKVMCFQVLSCSHSCLLLALGDSPEKLGLATTGSLGEPLTHFLSPPRAQCPQPALLRRRSSGHLTFSPRLPLFGIEPVPVASPTPSEALQVCTLTGDICIKQGPLPRETEDRAPPGPVPKRAGSPAGKKENVLTPRHLP